MGGQQFVGQRVLQAPEARDESIHPLGKFRSQRQGSRSFSVKDLSKQAPVRLRQVLGFPSHHASQGPQALQFSRLGDPHSGTPCESAMRCTGCSGVDGSTSRTSTLRPPSARSRRAPNRSSNSKRPAKRCGHWTNTSTSPPRWASSVREPNSSTRASSPTSSWGSLADDGLVLQRKTHGRQSIGMHLRRASAQARHPEHAQRHSTTHRRSLCPSRPASRAG